MTTTTYAMGQTDRSVRTVGATADEAQSSAISWGAVIAGAVAAAATTFILMALGTGIGLTMVSPWANAGASATTVGVSTVIGLIVVQWLSSAMGGYIAGRLRTSWVRVHTDEVFFRDTAHGFLAWALVTVVGGALLANVIGNGAGAVAKGTTEIAASAAGGAARAATNSAASASGSGDQGSGYFIDTMFRSANPGTGDMGEARGEAGRILTRSVQQDGTIALAPQDRTYLAQLIAARTGIAQPEAEQRVDTAVSALNDAQAKARAAADEARKRAAQFSIGGAIAMLIGAFIAAAMAAFGGNLRDEQAARWSEA